MPNKEGFRSFDEIEELIGDIAKDADLKTNKFNRSGRKKMNKADKSEIMVCAYVTEAQKKLIEEYCSDNLLSESTLLKQLLKGKGII